MSVSRVPSSLWVVLCLAVFSTSACTSDTEPPETTVAAATGSPVQVVSALLTAIDEGRFDDTARYTDQTQAALFTLGEGATASEVADAMEGSGSVAANFWSGFAQSLEGGYGPNQVSIGEAEEVTEGSTRFAFVPVTPQDGTERVFVLRRDDGWRVDLFASFAPIVGRSLLPAVEGVLGSANADASEVLSALSDSADSLRVAVSDRDLAPDTQQTVLALLERVSRAGG